MNLKWRSLSVIPGIYFHGGVGIDHGYCDPEFSLPACQENYQLLPVRDSGCHYYVSCENFKARLKKCPREYLFNPETSTCVQNYSCLHPCELYPDIGFTANEPKVPECPTKNGLYEIPGSECSKYIKCDNGNREIVTCPSGTWFNPNLQLCTFNYKCHQIHCVPVDPQLITTKSIEKKTTTINITWDNEVESKKINNLATEKSSSTKTEISSSIKSEKTTTADHQKEYNIPKCSYEGMIKIGQDGNCINYLNCTYTPDGWRGVIIYCGHLSIKQEEHTGPAEQSNKMIKDEHYVTQDIKMRNQFDNTYSFTGASTDHRNKIISNNNNILRTIQTTQQEIHDGSLGFESKYRNDNCLQPQKIVPQCKAHGKFPVTYSNCKEYVQCKFTLSLTTGPGWLSSLFTCKEGFFFDPKKGDCSSNYTCDEVVPCERRNPLETADVYSQLEDPAFTICENGEILMVPKCRTNEPGRQPISGTGCKKYLVCTLHSGEFKSKIFNCPEFYYFDPKKSICDPNYKCEDEDFCAEKKLNNPIYAQQTYTCPENGKELAIPRCESRGRFRFENTGCKKFLECIETDHGLIPKVSNCPIERYFDPETETCEFENTCLDIDMCSSYNSSFIQCPNGYIIQLPTCQNFGLKAVGGTGCKKYIQCFRAYSRYYSVIDCADGTYFNPDKLRCESYYKCNDKNFCSVQPKIMKSIFSLANKKHLLPIYYNFTRRKIERTTKVYRTLPTIKSDIHLSTKSKPLHKWLLRGKDNIRDSNFHVPLPTIKTFSYTKPARKPFNSNFANRRIVPEKYSSIKTTTIKTTRSKQKNRWENNMRTKATTRRTTKRKRLSTKHNPTTPTPKSFMDWLFPLRKAATKKNATPRLTTTTTQKSLLKLFSIFD